jgi:hypothetical protein
VVGLDDSALIGTATFVKGVIEALYSLSTYVWSRENLRLSSHKTKVVSSITHPLAGNSILVM